MNEVELARRTETSLDSARLLHSYVLMMQKWNRTQNLTSVANEDDIVSRHLVDTLPLIRALPENAHHVADMGSGAGIPGIPIAIAKPQIKVTLIESRLKRTVFLRQCRIDLNLLNVDIHHGRIESWMPENPPDFLVSRATAPLWKLVELSRHLVGPETCMLVLKGNDPREEIGRIASTSSLQVSRIEKIASPQSNYMVRLAAA